MAFTIRQGLEARDSVMGAYDPCPVVIYESEVNNLFNFRYFLTINRRVNSAWEEVSTIKRIPNKSGTGVFDMSQVLRNAVTIGLPSTGGNANDPAQKSNTSEVFQIVVGYEASTTLAGSITTTIGDTRYSHVIAGAYLDQFTDYNNTPITDYVLDSNLSPFLTNRESYRFQVGGVAYVKTAAVYLGENDSFSLGILSTDLTPPFDTLALRLSLTAYVAGVGTQATTDITLQEVSNTAFEPETTTAVTTDLWIGPGDFKNYAWASAFSGLDWSHIEVEMQQAASSNAPQSKKFVMVKKGCGVEGMSFKYLNKFGTYDYVFCQGHTQENLEYTRDTFTTGSGNWATADGLADATNLLLNDPTERQTISEVTNKNRAFTASTGYISRYENDLVLGLLESKRVWATKFVAPRVAQGTTYYPATITNSSMRAMFQQTDKLIEYSIEFTYANPVRTTA